MPIIKDRRVRFIPCKHYAPEIARLERLLLAKDKVLAQKKRRTEAVIEFIERFQPVNSKAIASQFNRAHSSMNNTLARLVRAGLVKRSRATDIGFAGNRYFYSTPKET